MDDVANKKSGGMGIRFPSNNTIEFNFPFKVDEGVRKYISAALGMVTGWCNVEKAETHPGVPQMEIVSAMEMDNYGWIMQTLERVGPECSIQFTVPHKTRALKAVEIFGQLATVEAPPMRINLTYKWEALESPLHYTTVECTWAKRADLQKLLTDAAQFPNVAIGGVGEQERAWVTMGGKGTNPGVLSSLQCPEITRV